VRAAPRGRAVGHRDRGADPLDLQLGELERHRGLRAEGRADLADRALELGDRRTELEGDEATVGGDDRAHVEDHAVLDDVDDRVGDRGRLRDLHVEVLHVDDLVEHGQVGAAGVGDQDPRVADQLDPLRLLDRAEDQLGLEVVEVGPLEGEPAVGLEPLAAVVERAVPEVLDAPLDVAVLALVVPGAQARVGPDLAAELRAGGAVAEVVEDLVGAQAGLAEAAEVDADVLEEVVLHLDEARLDVDHDPGRLTQVGQELADLLVNGGGLVDDHDAHLVDHQAVRRIRFPRLGVDVVADELVEQVAGDDVRLALDRVLLREHDAAGDLDVDLGSGEVRDRVDQVANLVGAEHLAADHLFGGDELDHAVLDLPLEALVGLSDQIEDLPHAALGQLEVDHRLLLAEVLANRGADDEVDAGQALQVGRHVRERSALAVLADEERREADLLQAVVDVRALALGVLVLRRELLRLPLVDLGPAAQVVEDHRIDLDHVHRVQLLEGEQPLLLVVAALALGDALVAGAARDLAQRGRGGVPRVLDQDHVADRLRLLVVLVQEGLVGLLVEGDQLVLEVLALPAPDLFTSQARLLALALPRGPAPLLAQVDRGVQLAVDALLVERFPGDQRVVAEDHLRLPVVQDRRLVVRLGHRGVAERVEALRFQQGLGALDHRALDVVLQRVGGDGVAVTEERLDLLDPLPSDGAPRVDLERRGVRDQRALQVRLVEEGVPLGDRLAAEELALRLPARDRLGVLSELVVLGGGDGEGSLGRRASFLIPLDVGEGIAGRRHRGALGRGRLGCGRVGVVGGAAGDGNDREERQEEVSQAHEFSNLVDECVGLHVTGSHGTVVRRRAACPRSIRG